MHERSSIPPTDEAAAGLSGPDDNSEQEGNEGIKTKDPAAVALGRLGGLKGGHARAAKMTPEERSEIARRAAVTRWSARSRGK